MAKTDASQEPDRRRGPSWLPATVAMIAVAAFLGWLATREPPESVAVAEPGDTIEAGAATDTAQQIELDVLNQSATTRPLIGEMVAIESARVSDILGTNMFWIELPGGAPFLIRLDDANIAAGAPLPALGTNVRVVGRVLEKDAALIERWAVADSLNEDQRMLADFGGTFIEARRVESAGS